MPEYKWKECLRTKCTLTALWQVGVESYGPECHHNLVTSLVVCGLHKESVTLDDFSKILDDWDPEHHHSSHLLFLDISEGYWLNPKTKKKEKYW